MSPDLTSNTTTEPDASPTTAYWLKVGIDGQLDSATTDVGLGLELLDELLAAGGDFDPLSTWLSKNGF